MSFDRRFEIPNPDDVDQTQCETCIHKNYQFACGQIGYCITTCGESYVVGTLLHEKGYGQCNLDWFNIQGIMYEGIELTNRECRKLMQNLHELGYPSTLHHHPLQKRALSTVIVDNYKPIELCHVFQELEAIK